MRLFVPLHIYNGTPEWRLYRDIRATLLINELKGKYLQQVCQILNLHRYIILQITELSKDDIILRRVITN